jgi:hypothetical protein
MLRLFRRKSDAPTYEPLPGGSEGQDSPPVESADAKEAQFSWIEYAIFLLLGVSMLWAWFVTSHILQYHLVADLPQEHVPRRGALLPAAVP